MKFNLLKITPTYNQTDLFSGVDLYKVNHRWVRLEEITVGDLVQPPCPSRSSSRSLITTFKISWIDVNHTRMLTDHELSWLQYYLWSLLVCIWKRNGKTWFLDGSQMSQMYVREYNDRESSSCCIFYIYFLFEVVPKDSLTFHHYRCHHSL